MTNKHIFTVWMNNQCQNVLVWRSEVTSLPNSLTCAGLTLQLTFSTETYSTRSASNFFCSSPSQSPSVSSGWLKYVPHILHCITLYIILYYTVYYTVLHCILYCITLHIILHYTVYYTAYYIVLHCILYCILHYILYCILHCITLH